MSSTLSADLPVDHIFFDVFPDVATWEVKVETEILCVSLCLLAIPIVLREDQFGVYAWQIILVFCVSPRTIPPFGRTTRKEDSSNCRIP